MDLTEDLIVEIICYLPLKLVIQCKCLNKSFKRMISNPYFAQKHKQSHLSPDLVLFSTDTSFRQHDNDDYDYVNHPPSPYPPTLIQDYYKISPYTLGFKNDISPYVYLSPLPSDPSCPPSPHYVENFRIIMSSPNSGRILLQLFHDSFFCVLNPVTGAYFIVPKFPSMFSSPRVVGLVDEVSSSHYKLVAVMSDSDSHEQLQVAIFESERNSWRHRTYETSYIGRRLTKYNDINLWSFEQPVHMHGCLHFARLDGTILVFDVNKESLGIIKKPDGVTWYLKDYVFYRMWFGLGGDSLVLAVPFEKRIAIYVPDNLKNKWRSKITISIPAAIQDPTPVTPIFYDGDDILMFTKELIDIYIYKIKGGILQKIANSGGEFFHPFVPNLIDIPGCRYLKSNNEKIELKWGEGEECKDYMDTQGLLNLQSLLRGGFSS